MKEQLALITTYFSLVDAFETAPTAYAAVLHPDVIQTEFPNLLYKSIQHRSFTEILDNLRIGRELLQDSRFDVSSTQPCADGSVVVEGVWQATVISDVGPFTRGQRLSAQLSLIFEFKDGQIFRQRRYPCYEPF
ncbi:nuclear transport factor 2 family protein [Hymenobacter metallicola]|uniref:Nuclear transport factor 2 family protein n=1 Tax=Hymenobacter metallicola TaxID=2563114 RepID=A0A4Z0QEF1_9BACT|nr:nuclear transport factor 2 family protein [Hymenobacter metallicola]TGE27719.1 nuclear transport factor 2 family protein [Hymenobacter metallicola]